MRGYTNKASEKEITMEKIIKYPRTPHIKGSRLQAGDEDLSQIPFEKIKGKHVVVEEKVDGANVAVSFTAEGELLLQSRGRFLTGGYREKHYNLFKIWAAQRLEELYLILEDRYVMYGEWLHPKHRLYYDALPDYFLEFDILDKKTMQFLDTGARRAMLEGSSIFSVPVLAEGVFRSEKDILNYLGKSNYQTDSFLDALREEALKVGVDPEEAISETDTTPLMEGLYLKIEEGGFCVDRMKYVRYGYSQIQKQEDGRWLAKPIIANRLKEK